MVRLFALAVLCLGLLVCSPLDAYAHGGRGGGVGFQVIRIPWFNFGRAPVNNFHYYGGGGFQNIAPGGCYGGGGGFQIPVYNFQSPCAPASGPIYGGGYSTGFSSFRSFRAPSAGCYVGW